VADVEGWGGLPDGHRLPEEAPILFPKVEGEKKQAKGPAAKTAKKDEAATIAYDDFAKLDLRVARVKSVEKHPNADRLLVIKLDVGGEERTVVGGLHGMLLAAEGADGTLALLQPDREVESGSKIS